MRIIIAAISFFIGLQASAQLNVSFDFSNAEKTIALLKKDKLTETEIDSFIKTEGVKVIIKKIKSSDSIARIVLRKISNKEKLTGSETNFQYESIKKDLPAIDSFITLIKKSQQQITDSIRELTEWMPAGKKLDVKVVFILGGYSSGFTFFNSDAFYIGAHQYNSDLGGIVNACKHELFHNVQHGSFASVEYMEKLQKDSAYKELYAYYLSCNLFLEGLAEYVADAAPYKVKGKYIKEQIEHSDVNKYRQEDNFYLIDAMVVRAYEEAEKSDMDRMYSILFDWNWNNPGYFTGKLMSQALAKEYGRNNLKKYLSQSPMIFILDYISLARSKPKLYPYNFSEKFESVIKAVVARKP